MINGYLEAMVDFGSCGETNDHSLWLKSTVAPTSSVGLKWKTRVLWTVRMVRMMGLEYWLLPVCAKASCFQNFFVVMHF